MRAQVVSIGSELILGHLTDTNATFLAQQLATLGIDLVLVTQVGDDRDAIAGVIRQALSSVDVVVCTGGVGPTEDDLTREAISDVADELPVVDTSLATTIEAFFHARGLVMPERNRKQAWLIPSAEALVNPVGTAPGWYARLNDRVVIAMPGVPREMFRMWEEQAKPRLARLEPNRVVRSTTIRTIGIGESLAEQELDDLVRAAHPVVATYAKDDGVHVRVTAIAADESAALRERDEAVVEVERRLRRYVYGRDSTTLASSLLALLGQRGWSVSIADAGGGGRFFSLLTSDPLAGHSVMASRSFVKRHEEALTLASGALGGSGANLGIGITVEVTEASPGVFEGVVDVAIDGVVAAARQFPMRSGYEDIQRRSALMAAEVLRIALIES